jgi:hypothetical protein
MKSGAPITGRRSPSKTPSPTRIILVISGCAILHIRTVVLTHERRPLASKASRE